MSIQPVTLVERLELLVCMTSMALSCGLLVLICAQKGNSGWAWACTLGPGSRLQVVFPSGLAYSSVGRLTLSRPDYPLARVPALFLPSRVSSCTFAAGEGPEGVGTRIAARRAWIAESRGLGYSVRVPTFILSTDCHEWSNGRCPRALGGPKAGPQSVGGPLAQHARCRLAARGR